MARLVAVLAVASSGLWNRQRSTTLAKATAYLTDRRYRSFQFELAAIESHHLVHIRDAELVKTGAVGLPDID